MRELRGEMKNGFKDVQREFTDVRREFTDVRREAKDEFTKVRSEMKAGFDGVNRLIIWGGSGAFFVLLAAIRL
ncbi:MAG TPA: hypothetical protein VGO24_07300 [Solirubrobacterales bacterium]|nr:hypothetical protein [Solirubrobacterales bacterium]